MTQLIRKNFKKEEQLKKLSRSELLKLRESTKQFRDNARQQLATNLTLTDKEKLEYIIDYIVGVPLEI